MRVLTLLVLYSTGPFPLEEALARLQQALEARDYATAAARCDALHRQGIRHGRFYLAQGNAHFLAGHLPEAILAYRRAERFLPNDRGLRANLAEARGQVLDPPAVPTDRWPSWLPKLSRLGQARLALAGYLVAWGLMLLGLWRPRRWLWAMTGSVLVLSLTLGVWANHQENTDYSRPLAVVAADGVVLRQGNGDSYSACDANRVPITLNRGVELRLRHERPNGWVQVELADGTVGWVPRQRLLVDEPPGARE